MLAALSAGPVQAQETAALQGQVVDPSGAPVPGAAVAVSQVTTGIERTVHTDQHGSYQLAALAPGDYRVEIRAPGFETIVYDGVVLTVAATASRNATLRLGTLLQEVSVTAGAPQVERNSVAVGELVDLRTVRQAPLNGRQFLELGLLAAGSVTPPQNAFLSAPTRGQGQLGLNTAGNREDTVNVQINGVTLNDQVNNILTFQPPLGAVREFRIDNALLDPEYSRNSGAVINVATQSGTNTVHGSVFEFHRNDALDARNFFERTASPAPFERNQFGGDVGGPIARNRTFFFLAFEGLRQQQGLTINSVVLSDAQRLAARSPVIARLIDLIPRANSVDQRGTPRFAGSTDAAVATERWALDVSQALPHGDRLHGFYAAQRDRRPEPLLGGNTLPGFGDVRDGFRQILTLSETHVAGTTVNELRGGVSRIRFDATAGALLNPVAFGIASGVTEPIGLPQINVQGAFNFGSPTLVPGGRTDTEVVVADRVNMLRGRHALKAGGDLRRFFNDNYQLDTGLVTFPTVDAFLADTASAFSIILGDRASRITQRALGLFVQDLLRWRPNLTLDLGARYDWYMTPHERDGRFSVFDAASVSLVPIGADEDVIRHDHTRVAPRAGIIWTPAGRQDTVVRAGYGVHVEQPMTNLVTSLAGNPPLVTPLAVTGTIPLGNAIGLARAAGIAPITVDPDYQSASVQSWNVTVDREWSRALAVRVGYVGTRGTHLRLTRNLNQPIVTASGASVRPYPALSPSSPVRPGTALANIIQVEGSGASQYNGLWTTATRRLHDGLQFSASYTLAKSTDTNSYSSPPTVVSVQDSRDIQGNRGRSDFDVRHRLVLSGSYDLPWRTNVLARGWQLAAIVQLQSGNPVNLVTSNTTLTGVPNTVRPDVTGPVTIIGDVERWFDTTSFTPAASFGNLGRNVVIGPGFSNTDLSAIRTIALTGSSRVRLRADAFNVFNRPNFGQPGRIVGSADFGRITDTRFPTGDSGSSRQIQLAVTVEY